MTDELRTLKDLMPYLGVEGLRREKGFGDAAFVNVDLLKQEAIKWVKFLRKKDKQIMQTYG